MTDSQPERIGVEAPAAGSPPLWSWRGWALALIAGLLMWSVAPANWEEGLGTVSIDYQGERVLDRAMLIGETEPEVFVAPIAEGSLEVRFPIGVPVDTEIDAEIRLLVEGQVTLAPGIADVNLSIGLPDGRQESIPITGETADGAVLLAHRRPTVDSPIVLGLLGFVAVMWVSETLPLFVTSLMIPVALVLFGVADPVEALAPFSNPIIILFFAGFLMAEAMIRSGLDHFVSAKVTALAGRSAVILFATMLGFTAFMSMWMSNTAAAAVLIPIALAITAPLENPGFRRALVLGIAYAATIGGVGSAVGTPANQLAIEFLEDFGGSSISFVEWFGFGVPLLVIFLPIMGVYLWWRSDVTVDVAGLADMQTTARKETARLGALTRDQITVLVTFVAVSIGWVSQGLHGVHAGVIALLGAVFLFAVGRLEPADLGKISWSSLLTFGGGLTLGVYVVSSGTSDFIAAHLGFLTDLPSELSILVVALVALGLTTLASNTVSAAILIPIVLPLGMVLGLDPTLLVVVVAIASSIDFALVVGTPPTMIAYSTKMYTAGQIFRTGVILDIVGILILVLVVTRIWTMMGIA